MAIDKYTPLIQVNNIPYYVRCCSIYSYMLNYIGFNKAEMFCGRFSWACQENMGMIKRYLKSKLPEEHLSTVFDIACGKLLYYGGVTGKTGSEELRRLCNGHRGFTAIMLYPPEEDFDDYRCY